MLDMTQMRTWAEIDLDALAHNYRSLRSLTPQGCQFLGLVKADAYGHGAVGVGKQLQQLGADMLAVASVAEGVQLRQGGITIPILCLGQTAPHYCQLLLDYELTQTVEDLATASALSQGAVAAGRRIKVHLKLDTGMGRLGFLWQEDNAPVLQEMVQLCALPGLEVEGMFTHFADADGSPAYTMDQYNRFLAAKQALEQRDIHLRIYHCGSSAAVLNYPCTHMDMIRPGVSLYGYPPDPDMPLPQGLTLRPVMRVKSRICSVRSMPKGSCISYGRTATLQRDSRLAVVPIGYGDGYPRQLSNSMEMLVHGVACSVVGRICMDMCMVDVTDLPQVQPGDVAVVYQGELTQRAAQRSDTIVYELLCRISPRVPRIYFQGGKEIPE